jgi:hypothetical protein
LVDERHGDTRQDLVRHDFLRQKCGTCGNEIWLDAGDILEGGKWYHRECWKPIGSGIK